MSESKKKRTSAPADAAGKAIPKAAGAASGHTESSGKTGKASVEDTDASSKAGGNAASQNEGDSSGTQETSSGGRRRGDILEQAILKAAWDELQETGYSRLTMEKIAVRAKTNKTAVYRRWPNKAAIVIAAVGKIMPKPDLAIPDTGNLRTDMFVLLQKLSKPLQFVGAETIHGLMVEYLGTKMIDSLPKMLEEEDKLTVMMRGILKQAEKRGEVDLEKISDQVISLPADLVRYKVLTTHAPIDDQTIESIVDEIFLPLVRKTP